MSSLFVSVLATTSNPALAADGAPTTIQAVYAVPLDATVEAGRAGAGRSSLDAVQDWFSSQTVDGSYPVFNRVGGEIDVQTVVLDMTSAQLFELSYGEMTTYLQTQVATNSRLFVFLEGEQDVGACGYSGGMIVIPMPNCDIYPQANAQFPAGITYLAAHELTHLLGAVASCAPNYQPGGHLTGDNRDILFQGSGGRDWGNLMLDPGNDDYYNHGRNDCYDIKDSPLLGTWETNGPTTPTSTTTTTSVTTSTSPTTASPTTTSPTTSAPPVICDGREATITGTSGDDVLTGTRGPDVIAGLQGNDTIRGLGGDDVICGGKGNDVIYGGGGFDILFGAQGTDVLFAADGSTDTGRQDTLGSRMFGGAGDDTIYGSVRWDRMQGGAGSDRLFGFEGRDWIRGGSNNDTVDGGANSDDLHGGNGNDLIIVDNTDTVRGGAGLLDRCTIAVGASPKILRSCERR